jgi:hypothetical protein
MHVKAIQAANITVDRVTPAGTAQVNDGEPALTLTAGQAVMITPN